MEDAVDALKMAFSVFAFVLALAIVFAMFSQAREVSDIVLAKTDNTYFTDWVSPGETNGGTITGRVVGIETIIPTLYRYYKEKLVIDIITSNNDLNNEKFDLDVERIVYRKEGSSDDAISYWKTYEDLYRNNAIVWLGNPNIDTQKRVSSYIAGKTSIVDGKPQNRYNDNNLKRYKDMDKLFIETFEQTKEVDEDYIYRAEDGSVIYLIDGTTKSHITYTLQQ